jgi:hypothetical protein
VPELTLIPRRFDPRSVRLTPEEGFVLSRIDQPVFARDVAAMTGLPADRVNEIVARLIEIGAVGVEQGGERVRRSVTNLTAVSSAHPTAPTVPAPRHSTRQSPIPSTSDNTPFRPREPDRYSRPTPAKPIQSESVARGDSERPSSGTRMRTAKTPPPETEGLQLFAREFSQLSPSERANRAQRADGNELVALCHDPHPQVVHALMANPRFSSRYARLVALYHKNPSGLELLARNRELVVDPRVQLCLLLNPNLTEPVLNRLMRKAALGDLHRLGSDSRVPEDVRRRLLNQLRERFTTADGEERADLIYWSEGRVLELLRGCTFDERTTSILSRKTYTSPDLVRQLAAFPATPPALLSALLRQAIVKERPALHAVIAAHPNAPRRAASGSD